MNKKIAVIGSGSMGTALAKVLYDAGNKNIVIYGIEKDELSDLKRGINVKYFPNSANIPNFETTNNLKEAVNNASYIVLAIPSNTIEIVYAQILGTVNSDVLIINGMKGFYPGTDEVMHTGLLHHSKDIKFIRNIVTLTGPSHAEDIVKEDITAVVAVSKDRAINKEVQSLFSNRYFRVYSQNDVIGAEISSIYKNIIAIASGAADEKGYGINTKALLLTRGIKEMSIMVKSYKGHESTVYGLTGLGDLIVTACSSLSRNYNFGRSIIKKGIKKSLSSGSTVEGLYALETMVKKSKDKELDTPILFAINNIIFKSSSFEKEMEKLLHRSQKPE